MTTATSTPAAPSVEQRVVLVKPGDLLILGNVGPLSADDHDALAGALGALYRQLGIHVAVFEADVHLDLLPGGVPSLQEVADATVESLARAAKRSVSG